MLKMGRKLLPATQVAILLSRFISTTHLALNIPSESIPPEAKKVVNYARFISAKSKKRMPSVLREVMKTVTKLPPEAILFGVGVPNVATFPFEEFTVNLKGGNRFKIEGADLEAALQYMPTSGHTPLISQLKGLIDLTHGKQDWTCRSLLVTCGASEPMAAAFDTILEEGDPIIIPVPIYTGSYDYLRPMGLRCICLQQDMDGIRPEELERILEKRKMESPNDMPKLMYINPTACNPTGRNLSLDRRRHLYKLACEYDFLLLEDDPYYSVNYTDGDIPSLLSMDEEGRVLRLDSFSKTLSSGLRVGYVTGPSELIQRIELHNQVTTLHTSGLSQVVVSKLLDYWGRQGYLDHIENVKAFYRERRDLMLLACNKYLKGLATWETPTGGMFLWIQIPVLKDTWQLAVQHCLAQNLLIVPGHPFTGDFTPPTYNFVRLSFSLATPDQIDRGIKQLSDIIKDLMKEDTA